MERNEIKQVIEAMLISTEEPLSAEQMRLVFDNIDTTVVKEAIEELKREYNETQRSFEINEVAGGYQIGTKIKFAKYLRKLYSNKNSERLSKPALETLAIMAYKQPVTRLDVEEIRGVNVDGVVRSLLEKGLIKIKGRKEVIGRPFLYGTSNLFLKYFGLKTLADLPPIEQFKEVADEMMKEQQEGESDNENSVSNIYEKPKVEEDAKTIESEIDEMVKAKQKQNNDAVGDGLNDDMAVSDSQEETLDTDESQNITKEPEDGTQETTQEN
jgi:segregation and condensation protein B